MSTQKVTYTEFLDEAPMSGFLYLLIFGICFAQLLDGLDFMSTSFALPGIIRDIKLSTVQAGLIGSLGVDGQAIGAILFTVLSDRFGRRPIFQWAIFSYVFGTLVCALAPGLNTLLVGRVIAGLGLGSETPIAVAVMSEFSPRRLRHIFVPIVLMFFAWGWVLAAVLSRWLVPAYGWRSVYWVGLVPAVSVIVVRRVLPESIRWLLAKGRVEEAGVIARDLARRSGRTDIELVPPEMTPLAQKQSFLQQFGALKTMWLPCLVLLVFMVTFWFQMFGMNAWLPTIFIRQGFKMSRSFTFSMIILVASPLSHLLTMWLQNKINRKWLLFIFTVISTVFFIVFGISFPLHLPIWVMVGAQFMSVLFFNPLVSIVLTLCGELFPTQVRTFGVGVISCAGRIGGAMGPLFMGVAMAGGMSITVLVNWLAFPMVVAGILVVGFIRIDPRNKSLEGINPTPMAEGKVAAGA